MPHNEENQTPDIKKATVMAVIAVILIFIGFGSIAGAAFMQGAGFSDEVIVLVVAVGFFGCNIVGVILIAKAYPALLLSDCMRADRIYEKQGVRELSLPDQNALRQQLLQHKFKDTENGYYRKKKFSFLKDSICYYIRIIEDVEVENAVRRETIRFDSMKKKENNLCLLLFIYMDEVGEREREEVKELGKMYIIMGTVINPKTSASVITTAVDSRTNRGYFMDVGKRGALTLYSYGCKLIREMFA